MGNQLNFNLKASRLVGEIQQLAVLINLETEMVCAVDYSPHVNKFEFSLCPDKETYMNRNATYNLDQVIESEFYLSSTDYWNDTQEKKEKSITKLIKIKRMLIKTIKSKGIDLKNPDLTHEQVVYQKLVI